jgi:hypothetical protein
MIYLKNFLILLALGTLSLAAGCTKPYKVLVDLEAIPERGSVCSVGNIVDELPFDMDPEDKPTAEDIEKLKNHLIGELVKKEVFDHVDIFDPHSDYQVRGSVLSFTRGSGFLRFLFGAFAGSAQVTVSLELYDKKQERVLFSGNFTGQVSDWTETGDKTFKQVAENFANEIKSQKKKLAEQPAG